MQDGLERGDATHEQFEIQVVVCVVHLVILYVSPAPGMLWDRVTIEGYVDERASSLAALTPEEKGRKADSRAKKTTVKSIY